MDNQIDLKQIITGFQFSMAWFVHFADALTFLDNKSGITSTTEEEYQEKIRPLKYLLSDLMLLVKDQTNILKEVEKSQSHTPVIDLKGH